MTGTMTSAPSPSPSPGAGHGRVAVVRGALADHVPHLPSAVVREIRSAGWLESVWTRGVLTGVVVASLAVLVWMIIRRRRTRWVVAAAAGTVVSVLLAGAAFVNSFAGYVPDTVAAERLVGMAPDRVALTAGTAARTGTVVRYAVGAPDLDIPSRPVWVYLPPGYALPGNQRRYPVVYLMHGYPGQSADWFAAGRIDTTMNLLLAAGAMPPAIIVAPDMNGGPLPRDTEGLDIVGGPQVQTYLTRTVPDWADATLRTIAMPRARVIGGMSSGGYVALNLGLRHQQVFGGILAQEPYGDPGSGALAELGGSRHAFAAQSPSEYLPTMRFIGREPTFVDVGSLARATEVHHLVRLLRSRGQPVYFRTVAGQHHTWTEARLGVAYGLVWTAQQLDWAALTSPVR